MKTRLVTLASAVHNYGVGVVIPTKAAMEVKEMRISRLFGSRPADAFVVEDAIKMSGQAPAGCRWG